MTEPTNTTQPEPAPPVCDGELTALLDRLHPASAEPLRSLYPQKSAGELAIFLSARFGASVVVTAGSAGAYTSTDGRPADHVPALVVDTVDAVGAGDAFNGGLLSALIRGKSLTAAVESGTACAALNCLSFGAREGMPDSNALNAFISGR